MSTVQLHPSWKERLNPEFEKPYMQALKAFLAREKAAHKIIFPTGREYFNALNSTSFEAVKVVILGQDPYPTPGHAHGLCFSVPRGTRIPGSLQNIFKEIQQDLKIPPAKHGCLTHWAEQGVLLLNSVLTVEQGMPAAHQGQGWEKFTDRIIGLLDKERQGLVFMLWGAYAQKKGSLIDRNKHLVLTTVHPSPLSAHRGFLGCRHFSKANDYLITNGQTPIDWQLPTS